MTRTRKEIEDKELPDTIGYKINLILEILLDIRDSLDNIAEAAWSKKNGQ